MKILKTEIKQRVYDGKHMLMALVPDYANMYKYVDRKGEPATFTPVQWIIAKVFDYEVEVEEWR